LRACPFCLSSFQDDVRFCPFHGHELTQVADLTLDEGDHVVGYRLERRLQQDALGTLFRVTKDKRTFALRVLHPHRGIDPTRTERLLADLKALRTIQHPAIARIPHAERTDDGLVLIFQEWIEGDPLPDLLQKHQRFSQQAAIPIARQLLDALDALHKLDLVHGALTPEALFIERTTNGKRILRVTNAALWRVLLPPSPHEIVGDNPALFTGFADYLSPEAIQGHQPSPTSDVYAVSALLYHLLTGKAPFAAPPPVAFRRHLQEDPLPVQLACPEATFAEGLQDIIALGLAKKEDERFQSTKAFAVALASIAPPSPDEEDGFLPDDVPGHANADLEPILAGLEQKPPLGSETESATRHDLSPPNFVTTNTLELPRAPTYDEHQDEALAASTPDDTEVATDDDSHRQEPRQTALMSAPSFLDDEGGEGDGVADADTATADTATADTATADTATADTATTDTTTTDTATTDTATTDTATADTATADTATTDTATTDTATADTATADTATTDKAAADAATAEDLSPTLPAQVVVQREHELKRGFRTGEQPILDDLRLQAQAATRERDPEEKAALPNAAAKTTPPTSSKTKKGAKGGHTKSGQERKITPAQPRQVEDASALDPIDLSSDPADDDGWFSAKGGDDLPSVAFDYEADEQAKRASRITLAIVIGAVLILCGIFVAFLLFSTDEGSAPGEDAEAQRKAAQLESTLRAFHQALDNGDFGASHSAHLLLMDLRALTTQSDYEEHRALFLTRGDTLASDYESRADTAQSYFDTLRLQQLGQAFHVLALGAWVQCRLQAATQPQNPAAPPLACPRQGLLRSGHATLQGFAVGAAQRVRTLDDARRFHAAWGQARLIRGHLAAFEPDPARASAHQALALEAEMHLRFFDDLLAAAGPTALAAPALTPDALVDASATPEPATPAAPDESTAPEQATPAPTPDPTPTPLTPDPEPPPAELPAEPTPDPTVAQALLPPPAEDTATPTPAPEDEATASRPTPVDPKEKTSTERSTSRTQATKAATPTSAEWVSQGFRHLQAKERDQAKEAFEAALALSPKHARATFGLGELYWDLRDFEKAAEFYREAAALAKNEASYLIKLGNSYIKLQRFADALAAYEEAATLARDDNTRDAALKGVEIAKRRLGL